MSSFKGKVIAVTGAASGIGLAVALHFASLGAKLSLTDASEANLKKAVNDIAEKFGHEDLLYRAADVRDAVAVDDWIRATVEQFAGLDGAVNAAGVHPKSSGVAPIWEVEDDDWQFAQDVNVKGVFNCVRAQLKYMVTEKNAGKGASRSIVVLGSNSSVSGAAKLAPYTASKHAVIGLARCAAMDAVHYGIRVNAVCPGPIDTPMLRNAVPEDQRKVMGASIPIGRLGTTAEVVGMISFLLSEQGGFCTGGVYMVDGGLTIL